MLLTYMGNVITLSECSCGVQRVRKRFPERPHYGLRQLPINLVLRRNRQDQTQNFRKH
jgi:hypothetical protein